MKDIPARLKDILRRIYIIGSTDEIESKRRIIVLNIIFTLVVVFLTPYSVIAYLQGSYLLGLFDLVAVILMIVAFFYLKHTRDYEVVAYTTTGFIGALLLYVIVTGGVNNTGPLWSYTGPPLVMFLLGTRKGAIWLSVYFGLILLAFFLPGTPLLLTTYSKDFILRFISTLLAVCVISFLLEWVRAKTQERIAEKTSELEKALTELKKADEERARLQSELWAARKMEAIGTLAGGLAHEFNNQLTVLSGNVEMVMRKFSDNKTITKKLMPVKNASEKIARLTNQLLSFSRKQILQLERVNVNDLINQVRYRLLQSLDENIKLEIVLEPDLWSVEADRGLMAQVLFDMVFNARDAMPEGGKLVIRTKNENTCEGEKGRLICLFVEDTGIGMDEETTQKIFEPFFTTKEVGEGVGLGLSFVYGTVKQHNGWIDVSSTPGMGTVFKVYLPAVVHEDT